MGEFLFYLTIKPIWLLFEIIFRTIYKICANPGISILAVSIVMNILVLPMYLKSDALQDAERKKQKDMEHWVKHIRKTFKGDERFLMLSEYYRQNDYQPYYVLKSSLSLLLQVPFFVAAYDFLSNLTLLQGTPFMMIKDLGQPDALIHFGGLHINLLPILMTAINLTSAAIYTRKGTTKEKVQTTVFALVFLVLLYNSPSGLVIYWIFNNLFSLAKNVVKKQKNPAKILFFALFGILAAFCALFWIFKPNASIAKKLILTLAVVIFAFSPKAISFFKSKVHKKNIAQQEDFPLFILSAAGLALLFGLVLPASTVSSDPIAFSFLGNTENPLSYIKNALSLYTGLFVVWGILIYKMFGEKVRIAETKIFAFLLAASLLNSFVFKFDYGTINILFNIEEEILQASYPILNLFAVLAGAAVVSSLIFVKKRNFLSSAVLILCIAELALSANDILNISTEFKAYKANIAGKTKDDMQSDIAPVYHLSREKKNVIVIFIDQAIGAFFPVLQTEHPEITEKFTGFTFFPNTASFSGATLYGSPAMMGGYDYTPENANKRADVPLRQKHNEAKNVSGKYKRTGQ